MIMMSEKEIKEENKKSVITKHDLNRMGVRWCFMGVNAFNYETQEGPDNICCSTSIT